MSPAWLRWCFALFGLPVQSLADRRVVPLSPQRLHNLKEAYLVTIILAVTKQNQTGIPTDDVCVEKRNRGGFFSGPESWFYVYHVCIKDQSFHDFEHDKIKLSIKEAKSTGLLARNSASIQEDFILKFTFGPKKLPGLSRKVPRPDFKEN